MESEDSLHHFHSQNSGFGGVDVRADDEPGMNIDHHEQSKYLPFAGCAGFVISMPTMLLELMERRYGETSTVFCIQYSQKDWRQRLGSGFDADEIMDRIIPNTIWVETGNYNMREHTALATA